MTMPHPIRDQNGVVAIMTILWVSILSLAALATVTLIVSAGLQMTGSSYASERTFNAAEAGLNQGIYRLTYNAIPGTFCTDFSGTTVACNAPGEKVTVMIVAAAPLGDPYERTVTARAEDVSGKVRTVSLNAQTSTFAMGLDYAVHAGAGGFLFENGSFILGDVYSNGNAEPGIASHRGNVVPVPDDLTTPENESLLFPGNLTVAGFGNKIVQMEISGTAWADILSGTNAKQTRAGVAKYNIIGPANPDKKVYGGPAGIQELCVSGTDISYTCGGATCYKCDANAAVPPYMPLPIGDTDIIQWENDIKSSVGAGIPSQHISGNTVWGPTKVEGDITFDNGAKLTVNGALWVTGNLVLSNGNEVTLGANALINKAVTISNVSSLRLAATVGENDGVIIVGDPEHPNSVDGNIVVSNGVDIRGSGDSKSALTLLSTNTSVDPDHPAIEASNTAVGVIYYAKSGLVRVKSTGDLNAVYAEKIYLDTNAKVTFKPSLQFFSIPNPNPIPVGLGSTGWREL